MIIGVAFVLLAAVAIIILVVSGRDCGRDADCFVARAQQCETAMLRSEIANGTIIKYEEKGCTVTTSIDTFGPAEPQIVVDYFKGKTMLCTYTQGQFDPALIKGLTTEGCTGTLRDAILGLQSAQLVNEAR